MSDWNFRLAEPADAPLFAKWVTENQLVDRKDIQAGLSKHNPTALVFVAECDGKPVAFVPVYCQLAVAHLGFNPEADADERKNALKVLLDGTTVFAYQMGIREMVTLTKTGYPVAQWAMSQGFEPDSREQFKLAITKYLNIEEPCAPVTAA